MPRPSRFGSVLSERAPTWPPPDTDRNRFVFRVGVVVGALATAYVMAFAMATGGWLPITVAVLLLAGTLLLGVGLLLMRTQRRAAQPGAAVPGGAEPGADPAVTPRRRPRSSPTAR